ncbi:hypothetical protein BHE74_00007495 [Ensete ventricosum]|nr:hypothetical protein GW17_00032848 [Ensete ventricosum]RWW83947.1 hypothetical protein BHE74_00007495 [Ensete ventricosum]RZR86088.1 hypothetical protein BHM03_00013191 [Ensete ventricosum]
MKEKRERQSLSCEICSSPLIGSKGLRWELRRTLGTLSATTAADTFRFVAAVEISLPQFEALDSFAPEKSSVVLENGNQVPKELLCRLAWGCQLDCYGLDLDKQNLNAPDTYAEVVVGLEEVAVLV